MPDRSTPPRRLGRPPGRDGQETRRRLLDAALELFALRGFEATTVRGIAERVGVRDAAIYAHFDGKQAIYDSLLAGMGPVSADALDVDLAELAAAGPRKALPGLVERLLDAWSRPRALLFASVVLREGAGSGGPGGLAALVDAARARLTEPFRQWQHDGALRTDVEPDQLVWELFAPLHIARFLHLRAGATAADEACAREVARAHVAFFLTCTCT